MRVAQSASVARTAEPRKRWLTTLRAFIILSALHLVLITWLIVWPYVSFLLFSQEVYQKTHNFGLDPTNWEPYGAEGIGLFLHDAAHWVWGINGLILPIMIGSLSFLAGRDWTKLNKVERMALVGLLSLLTVAAVLTALAGGSFLYWYLD
jgi:hypothetical protein